MRDFLKFLPRFWIETNRKIKNLGLAAEVTALYLLTSPHSTMLGIYYLPVTFITHETGISLEEACKTLRSLSEVGFCTYDRESEYVWVHEMAFYQIDECLKPQDNRIKGINHAYHKLPDLPFLQAFFEKYKDAFLLENRSKNHLFYEAPSKALPSKEKEKEKDKEKKEGEEKEKKTFMSGKPDVLPDTIFFEEEKKSSLKKQALEILEFLNEKTGRIYRPVDTNLKLIMARLKSGATLGNCFQVIAKKTREWKSDPKMALYLRPATLFNATKFEQYVGELVVPQQSEDNT